MCDNKFHTQSLKDMLQDKERYGFIVVDGNGALFANVQGNSQNVLYKWEVSLPKKHSKGGQSSVRFARLRVIARHNYLTRVNELAVKLFWDQQNNRSNVSGIVLAGSADFKDVFNSKRLDPRLQKLVVTVVDVAYGFNQGLNQAIEIAGNSLKDVVLVKQRKMLSRFFEEISTESGRYCFGVEQMMEALNSGIVQNIIVWDKLDVIRQEISLKDGSTKVVFSKEGKSAVSDQTKDQETIVDSVPLIDWLAENYRKFGAKIEIVQDSSAEGSQFCRGFGGIGGILRYKHEFFEEEEDIEQYNDNENGDDSDDDLSEYFDVAVSGLNGKEEIDSFDEAF